jgi:hypothetical protein
MPVTTAELNSPAAEPSGTKPVTWHGRAFGLEIDSNAPFDSIAPPTDRALTRRVSLDVEPPGALKDVWSPRDASVLSDRSMRAGRPLMRVEADPELGYRIWAPGHGRHLVSSDGTRIRSSVPRSPDRRWERLLMAQPLPLAALLQGLELFHASAVELGGRTVAFVAESGTGKTSLAARLVSEGAGFVTDDVLALEILDRRVIAHAGATVLHLSDAELNAIDPAKRARVGAALRQTDKVHFAVRADSSPRRLTAVYFLSRGPAFKALEIEDVSPPEPRQLLASAFITYLETPARLLAQLDFCAGFAQLVPAFRVRVPRAFGAAALAEEIGSHVEHEL